MKDSEARPGAGSARRGGGPASSRAARIEALACREGFALEQDAIVTDLLSNAGEAADIPDSLYILLAEVCTCLYHLEAITPATEDNQG